MQSVLRRAIVPAVLELFCVHKLAPSGHSPERISTARVERSPRIGYVFMLRGAVNGRAGRNHTEDVRIARSLSQDRKELTGVHDTHDFKIGGIGREQIDMEERINLADLLVTLILGKSEQNVR